MPDRGFLFQSHFEAWKGHNRQLRHWALGTLLFTVLGLIRFLGPYVERSSEQVETSRNLAEVERRLRDEETQLDAMRELIPLLDAAATSLADPFWQNEIDGLKAKLGLLGDYREEIASIPAEEQIPLLEAARRTEAGPGVSDGAAGAPVPMEQAARPRPMQAEEMERVPQTEGGFVPRVQATPNAPGILDPFPRDEVHADSDTLRTALDIHGNRTSIEAFRRERRDLPQESRRVGAIRDLDLHRAIAGTPADVEGMQHAADRRALEIAQSEADATLRRILDRVQMEIIAPLETLGREIPSGDAVARVIEPTLDQLRRDVEGWDALLIGSPDWWRTVGSKDDTVEAITRRLRTRQQSLTREIDRQRNTLQTERESLEREAGERRAEKDRISDELAALEEKLQTILPSWTRGFVSPQEIVQSFPLVVIGLLLLLAGKAGVLRRHAFAMRRWESGEIEVDRIAVVSSIWTPIRRGFTGTVATAALYVAGICWLAWCFERGIDLTTRWLQLALDGRWGWLESTLPMLRWLGRTACLAAAVALAVVLARPVRVGFEKSKEATR